MQTEIRVLSRVDRPMAFFFFEKQILITGKKFEAQKSNKILLIVGRSPRRSLCNSFLLPPPFSKITYHEIATGTLCSLFRLFYFISYEFVINRHTVGGIILLPPQKYNFLKHDPLKVAHFIYMNFFCR